MTPNWPDRYACVDLDGLILGEYGLRPIAWADRIPIREWRNARLEILRQAQPLSEDDQDRYFSTLVAPQMTQGQPPQVLVAFLHDDRMIGYGGLVHIDWVGSSAEVSFITEPARQSPAQFEADLSAFFGLIRTVAGRLGMTRLTTEVYAFRTDYIAEAERFGFVLEGRVVGHAPYGGGVVDALQYGLRLDA